MSDQAQGPGWWQASDGKWYPPEQAPQQPAFGQPPMGQPVVYAPQTKSGMHGCLIAFIVVASLGTLLSIIIAIVAAVTVDDAVDDVVEEAEERADDLAEGRTAGEEDEIDDVELTDCRRDDLDALVAVLEVSNNSPDPSSYFIDVVFENPAGDRQLGRGVATVDQLRDGQSTTVEASTFVDVPRAGRFECRVAEVQRLAS